MFKFGYFISIGAGKNQLPLILKAKDLGLKVISIDLNKNAPGFKYSEICIVQSVLDYRKIYSIILKLILDEPIVGIGVRSYGKAVLTAGYLSEKLKLIGTKPDVLAKFYNKKTMKSYLGKQGILVPISFTWSFLRDFPKLVKSVSYPCILKPVNNIAKIGIEVFQKPDSLLQRLNQLKPKNDRFLLEEFIEGSELTVIGFVQNKRFILISISDKVTTSYPPFIELSHQIPTAKQKVIGEIKLICQNIVQLTDLENSPIVAEFKVTSRGEIYLIEIMPEIGGEYLADFLIPEFYSYDYFLNYIQLQTGNPIEPVNYKLKRKKDSISQICFIAPPEGNSTFVSHKNFEVDKFERVFLNIPLKSLRTNLNSKEGNACRVQVFGVSSSNTKKPMELDSDIRRMYDAKFE